MHQSDLESPVAIQKDDDPRETSNWTDSEGITHIYINDDWREYELINGQWVERSPF